MFMAMMQNVTDLRRRLSKVVEQQQKLLTDFHGALAKTDTAEQAAIQKQLRYAQSESRAAVTRPRARAAGKTMRELVLDMLDEVGVPLAPSTVSEFIHATTGIDLAASRFASLRRDEERAARRDMNARPAWVVPALNTARLNAIPRLLTSSAWELDRRLIGARSLRVIHLHTTLAFLQRFERLQATNAPQANAIESLVLRYARGVPGALATGQATDPEKIRKVTTAELEAIEAGDLVERQQAAARLSRYGDQQRLWGLPSVIEGNPQGGRAGA
jgi:hypothetical protein